MGSQDVQKAGLQFPQRVHGHAGELLPQEQVGQQDPEDDRPADEAGRSQVERDEDLCAQEQAERHSECRVIVLRSTFDACLQELVGCTALALDTETTGLRPYHGDRLFSLILGTASKQFYFNFQAYEGVDLDHVLNPGHLRGLGVLFRDVARTWYLHNAKFDMAFLAQEGVELLGTVHDTKALALIEYNEHSDYSLAACGERIGYAKDDSVEKYLRENKLHEKRDGATQRYTHYFYDRVPFELISKYGCRDAEVTYRLGQHQEEAFQRLDDGLAPSLPPVSNIARNERRLTHTVFRMERAGVRIDRPYCVRAARYETDRAQKAMAEFERETGKPFANSPKLYAAVFESDRQHWEFTDKGNPSFASEALQRFAHPAAKAVLTYRDAVSKVNFYRGFLYHADRDDVVHPNFNPDGAGHGRFSSSNPNFQNLTSEEGEEDQEFLVRRAIIPRPGFILYGRDFNAMEYAMLFDQACKLAGHESGIVKMMKEKGLDPHQATADAVTAMGTPLTRKKAKNGNFAFLYGSGNQTLADTIGCTVDEAARLKQQLRAASPEVADLIRLVTRTAEVRGWIFNWAGRRCHFPDPKFAYRAVNYLISGGCADVNKMALNLIDEYLLGRKSRLIMTIHDEVVLEVADGELEEVSVRVRQLMESVYPAHYLPLTTSGYFSAKSLADLETCE